MATAAAAAAAATILPHIQTAATTIGMTGYQMLLGEAVGGMINKVRGNPNDRQPIFYDDYSEDYDDYTGDNVDFDESSFTGKPIC